MGSPAWLTEAVHGENGWGGCLFGDTPIQDEGKEDG